jgi:O-antigen/teichoic acid export membrane protein
MIKKLKNRISKLDEHTLEVVKKSSASMIVKTTGMLVGLLVSIFLGRTIGAEGLGIINLANTIASLLIVITLFGFNNVLIKNIAISHYNKDWRAISQNIYTSTWFNGSLAFLLALIGILSASYFSRTIFNNPNLEIPLIIAIAMIIPQTFSRVFASGLNGFRKIWQSNLVNEALSIWVVAFGIVILQILKIKITVINVAILYAIGRLVVSCSIFVYWKSIFTYKGEKSLILKPMLKMALPLLLVSGTSIIASNADALMLGWLSDVREVGLYTVAARLALLVSIFLQVSNAAISPKLASLFATNNIVEINILVKRVTLGLVIIAILFLIVFIIGGNFILGLWGNEFKEAYLVLIILAVGQFFNISTGCAGMLLIMCGFEKIHGYISLFFMVLNLILNYILIVSYGAVGAAIATAITVGFENIAKLILVKNKIGISTIPKF